jgi:hypothetical protein
LYSGARRARDDRAGGGVLAGAAGWRSCDKAGDRDHLVQQRALLGAAGPLVLLLLHAGILAKAGWRLGALRGELVDLTLDLRPFPWYPMF